VQARNSNHAFDYLVMLISCYTKEISQTEEVCYPQTTLLQKSNEIQY